MYGEESGYEAGGCTGRSLDTRLEDVRGGSLGMRLEDVRGGAWVRGWRMYGEEPGYEAGGCTGRSLGTRLEDEVIFTLQCKENLAHVNDSGWFNEAQHRPQKESASQPVQKLHRKFN